MVLGLSQPRVLLIFTSPHRLYDGCYLLQKSHDNGAVGRSVWLSDRMEPPEIVRELFGSAPLPHMNPAKEFPFKITQL